MVIAIDLPVDAGCTVPVAVLKLTLVLLMVVLTVELPTETVDDVFESVST